MQENLIKLIQKQGNYLNGLSNFFRELGYETDLKKYITYKFNDPTKTQLNFIYENSTTYTLGVTILVNNIKQLHLFSCDTITKTYNLFYIDPEDNNIYCVFDAQGYMKLSFIEFIKRIIHETK